MKQPAKEEFVLRHPCGVRICRSLRVTELDGAGVENHDELGNGGVRIRLTPVVVDGARLAMSMVFLDGVLKSLELCLLDAERYGASWEDWREEKERKRARDTAQWLKGIGYPAGRYHWGEIRAGYDEKAASGGAIVRFEVGEKRLGG